MLVYEDLSGVWTQKNSGRHTPFDLAAKGFTSVAELAIFGDDVFVEGSGMGDAVAGGAFRMKANELPDIRTAPKLIAEGTVSMQPHDGRLVYSTLETGGYSVFVYDLETSRHTSLGLTGLSSFFYSPMSDIFHYAVDFQRNAFRLNEDNSVDYLDDLSLFELRNPAVHNSSRSVSVSRENFNLHVGGDYYIKAGGQGAAGHPVSLYRGQEFVSGITLDVSLGENAWGFYNESLNGIFVYEPAWNPAGLEINFFRLSKFDAIKRSESYPFAGYLGHKDADLIQLSDSGALYYDNLLSQVMFVHKENLDTEVLLGEISEPISVKNSDSGTSRLIYLTRDDSSFEERYHVNISEVSIADEPLLSPETARSTETFDYFNVGDGAAKVVANYDEMIVLRLNAGLLILHVENGDIAKADFQAFDENDPLANLVWIYRSSGEAVLVFEVGGNISTRTASLASLDAGRIESLSGAEPLRLISGNLRFIEIPNSRFGIVDSPESFAFVVIDLATGKTSGYNYASIINSADYEIQESEYTGVQAAQLADGERLEIYFSTHLARPPFTSRENYTLFSANYTIATEGIEDVTIEANTLWSSDAITLAPDATRSIELSTTSFERALYSFDQYSRIEPYAWAPSTMGTLMDWDRQRITPNVPFWEPAFNEQIELIYPNESLGNLIYAFYPWVYSEYYGWLYYGKIDFNEDATNTVWWHLPNYGYVYTSEDLFPYIYIDQDKSWAYLYRGPRDTSWIYKFSESQWETFEHRVNASN